MREQTKRKIMRFLYRILWGKKINAFIFIPLNVKQTATELKYNAPGMMMHGLHPHMCAYVLTEQVKLITRNEFVMHELPDVLKKMEKQFEK